MPDPTRIFLTGPPGCGKTTAIRSTLAGLQELTTCGFFTKEVREGGRRSGFQMMGLGSGMVETLASVHSPSELRLRRYGIELEGLDRIVREELEFSTPPDLGVIDEIGKIELYSQRFINAVRRILEDETPVLGTVAIRGEGLIQEVKLRHDVDIIEVDLANRDELPGQLAARFRRDTFRRDPGAD